MGIQFAWEEEAVKYGNPLYTHVVWHKGRIWSLELSEDEAKKRIKRERVAYGYDPDYTFNMGRLNKGRV